MRKITQTTHQAEFVETDDEPADLIRAMRILHPLGQADIAGDEPARSWMDMHLPRGVDFSRRVRSLEVS